MLSRRQDLIYVFHAPILPKQWTGYSFQMLFRGRKLKVSVDAASATYLLIEGEPLTINHRGQELKLHVGKPTVIDISQHLEAVIFDLDGVITDTAEYHYQGWKRLAEELNIPFDRAFNEQLRGVSRLDSLRAILLKAKRGHTEEELQVWADKKNQYYLSLVESLGPKDLLPGVKQLLTSLKAAGIKLGIASASKNAKGVLDRLGVTSMFDAIADGTSIQIGKPDPEVFTYAAEKIGVDPKNCVGVEDAAAGIASIKAAGMTSIGIGPEEHLKGADLIVSAPSFITLELLKVLLAKSAKNERN